MDEGSLQEKVSKEDEGGCGIQQTRSGYRWMREGWELGGKSWRFNSDCCIALRELQSNTYKELSSSIFQSLSV